MASLTKPPLGNLADPGHPMAQKLLGAWLFNEGKGRSVNDSSGRNCHLKIQGSAGFNPEGGWKDLGYFFNGSSYSEYARGETGQARYVGRCYSNEFTVHALMKFPGTVANYYHPIFSCGAVSVSQPVVSFMLYGVASPQEWTAEAVVGDDSADNAVLLEPGFRLSGVPGSGQWFWCSVVRRARKARFFLNGLLIADSYNSLGTNSVVGITPATTSYLTIGAGYSTYYFKNYIGSVLYWDRALSDCEIAWMTSDPYEMFFDKTIVQVPGGFPPGLIARRK